MNLEAQEPGQNENGKQEQIATTEDGRKVILKADGTWEYAKEILSVQEAPRAEETPVPQPPAPLPETKPAVSIPESQKGVLSFEAAVPLKSGNVQPIAGSTFYLLDRDLNQILQTSGIKPEKKLSLLNTFSMAHYGSTIGVERSVKLFSSAMESIKPQIVATTTSSSDGKGEFVSIVPGVYYLMNVSVVNLNAENLTDRRSVLWNVKVQIQPGPNSIQLNESNAVR